MSSLVALSLDPQIETIYLYLSVFLNGTLGANFSYPFVFGINPLYEIKDNRERKSFNYWYLEGNFFVTIKFEIIYKFFNNCSRYFLITYLGY